MKQDLQKPQARSPSASTAGKPSFWKTPPAFGNPTRHLSRGTCIYDSRTPGAHIPLQRSHQQSGATCPPQGSDLRLCPPPPAHLGPGVAPDLRRCRSSASRFPHLQNGNNSFPQLQRSLCSLNISKACGRIYNYPKNHCEFSLLFQHLH